jgi:hypothetical protein
MSSSYTYKKIELDSGKVIEIFDNVFPFEFQQRMYFNLKNSPYLIGWDDAEDPELKQYLTNLHTRYSKEQLASFGIFKHMVDVPELRKHLDKYKFNVGVGNLTTCNETHGIHTHIDGKVFLYYVNNHWKMIDHGETLFYTEDRTGIEYAAPYVPGRLVVFDADIPHSIRAQTMAGPKFRFTLSMFFN